MVLLVEKHIIKKMIMNNICLICNCLLTVSKDEIKKILKYCFSIRILESVIFF